MKYLSIGQDGYVFLCKRKKLSSTLRIDFRKRAKQTMTITRVQNNSGSGTNIVATISFSTPSVAGNTIILALVTNHPLSSVPTGYTQDTTNNGTTYLNLLYYNNAPSQSSISLFFPVMTYYNGTLIEYSGLSGGLDISQTMTPGPTNIPPIASSLITSNSIDLILSLLATTDSVSYSAPTNGFGIITFGGSIPFVLCEKIVSVLGTYSANITSNITSLYFICRAAAFKGSIVNISKKAKSIIIPRRGRRVKF